MQYLKPRNTLYRTIDLSALRETAEAISRAVARSHEGRMRRHAEQSTGTAERNIFDIRTYDREIAARRNDHPQMRQGARKGLYGEVE